MPKIGMYYKSNHELTKDKELPPATEKEDDRGLKNENQKITQALSDNYFYNDRFMHDLRVCQGRATE